MTDSWYHGSWPSTLNRKPVRPHNFSCHLKPIKQRLQPLYTAKKRRMIPLIKLNFGFWKLVQVALMYRSTLPFPGWASAPLHWTELLICSSALQTPSTSLLPPELPKQNRLKMITMQHSVAFQCRWHFNGWTAPLALKSSCKQVFSQAILQAFVGSALQRNLLESCRALSGSVRGAG